MKFVFPYDLQRINKHAQSFSTEKIKGRQSVHITSVRVVCLRKKTRTTFSINWFNFHFWKIFDGVRSAISIMFLAMIYLWQPSCFKNPQSKGKVTKVTPWSHHDFAHFKSQKWGTSLPEFQLFCLSIVEIYTRKGFLALKVICSR